MAGTYTFKIQRKTELGFGQSGYNSCFHGREGLKRQRDLRTLHAVTSLMIFAFMIPATERIFDIFI